MSVERKYAAKVLQKVLEEKVFFKDALASYEEMVEKHKKFVTMLVLTTLRKKEFLEKILHKYIKKPLKNKDIGAKYLLLCATTELFYMSSPEYAVINEYVGIIKQQNGRFLSSMANAVLRNIIKDKNSLQALDDGYNLPERFRKSLENDYGRDIVCKIEREYAKQPKLDISIKQAFADDFTLPDSQKQDRTTLRLENVSEVEKIDGYADGKWWVQDYAATLAVKIAGNPQNQKVLDLCAAPGGKTAQLADGGAFVTAVDISASRLEKLAANMARLGFSDKVKIVCADAFDFLQNCAAGEFDMILVDSPCSASGTLRRHPEIPYIKSIEDAKKMAGIQQKMLAAAAEKLKSGGTLIYCVCSIFKVEGEDITADFLQKHPDFSKKEISSEQLADKRILTADGFLRTLPFYAGGTDAFFVAAFCKK